MQLQLATFAVTPSLTAATLLTYFSRRYADFEIIYSTEERDGPRASERDGATGARKRKRTSACEWRGLCFNNHKMHAPAAAFHDLCCCCWCFTIFASQVCRLLIVKPWQGHVFLWMQHLWTVQLEKPTAAALLMHILKYVNKFRIWEACNFQREIPIKPTAYWRASAFYKLRPKK